MKFSQNGWIVFAVAVVLALLVRFTLTGTGQIVGAVAILGLAGLIYKLTVLVDEFRLKIAMGVGIIGEEFAISEIEACRVYDGTIGFGFRRTNRHVIYNIASKRAVEVVVKGKVRTVLIGCDNPEELVDAINQYMR